MHMSTSGFNTNLNGMPCKNVILFKIREDSDCVNILFNTMDNFVKINRLIKIDNSRSMVVKLILATIRTLSILRGLR